MLKRLRKLGDWYVNRSKWWQRGLYGATICALVTLAYFGVEDEPMIPTVIGLNIGGIIITMLPLNDKKENNNETKE